MVSIQRYTLLIHIFCCKITYLSIFLYIILKKKYQKRKLTFVYHFLSQKKNKHSYIRMTSGSLYENSKIDI